MSRLITVSVYTSCFISNSGFKMICDYFSLALVFLLLLTCKAELTSIQVGWVEKVQAQGFVAAACLWAGLPVSSRSSTDLFHKVQLCSIFERSWPEVADKASAVTIQLLNSCLSDVAECP